MRSPPDERMPAPQQSRHPNNLDAHRSDLQGSSEVSGSPARLEQRCSNGTACESVVTAYVSEATCHAGGHHQLAEHYGAMGDATADRHGLWAQIEQDVAT